MRATEFITELFDPKKIGTSTPFELSWDTQFAPQELHADAYDRQGQKISVSFINWGHDIVEIEFTRTRSSGDAMSASYGVTNQGDAVDTFNTVLHAIDQYLAKYPAEYLVFSASGNEASRVKLYKRLAQRLAPTKGYEQVSADQLPADSFSMLGNTGVFVLRKKNQQSVDEEILDEMPLPVDWNPAQYGPGTTFKARLAYALERAKKIGSGSSRVATIIDYEGRPTVLKIAKNQKGLAQNNVEADILSDGYARQLGILIPIIDYDEQNREPTWIHTEMAIKATEQQLCTLMRCGDLRKLVDLANAIAGKANLHAAPMIQRMRNGGVNEADIETMTDYANTLADLTNSFDVDLADLRTTANWGLYKGKPVVIDAGANSDVLNQYYRKS